MLINRTIEIRIDVKVNLYTGSHVFRRKRRGWCN